MSKGVAYLKFDVDEFVDDLKHGVVAILFEKRDGTNRLLKGTLQPDYFRDRFPDAAERQQRADSLAKPGEEKVPVIHVWDVEENGWRSFRTDKVLSLQLTNG